MGGGGVGAMKYKGNSPSRFAFSNTLTLVSHSSRHCEDKKFHSLIVAFADRYSVKENESLGQK